MVPSGPGRDRRRRSARSWPLLVAMTGCSVISVRWTPQPGSSPGQLQCPGGAAPLVDLAAAAGIGLGGEALVSFSNGLKGLCESPTCDRSHDSSTVTWVVAGVGAASAMYGLLAYSHCRSQLSAGERTAALPPVTLWEQSLNFAEPREAPPPAPTAERVVLHYHRPEGYYGRWGLELWESVPGLTNRTVLGAGWFRPLAPTGRDAFWAYWVLPAREFGDGRVNFLVHAGELRDACGQDTAWRIQDALEIWVNAGDGRIYRSEEEAVRARPR